MTWRRSSIYVAIAFVVVVALGFYLVQSNGAFDNPNLYCDIAREC
jgi:hypothetical protein